MGLSKFIQAQKLLNYGELSCLNFPQKSLKNIMIPYKVSKEALPSNLQIQLKEKNWKNQHTLTHSKGTTMVPKAYFSLARPRRLTGSGSGQ